MAVLLPLSKHQFGSLLMRVLILINISATISLMENVARSEC